LRDRQIWSGENKWKTSLASVAVLTVIAVVILLVYNRKPEDVRSALLHGHYHSAFQSLEKKAKAGDTTAQNTLGNLYYLGLGVERDYAKAAHWYKQAAINGNDAAYVNMGVLHFRGVGVRQDLLRAYAWLRLADRAGRESAEHHLMYLSGINLITPNMMQQAHRIYGSVDDLIK
jgi:TPR repeat protein